MRDHAESGVGQKAHGNRVGRYGRDVVARKLEDVHARMLESGASRRRCAAEAGIPRTSMQYWRRKQENLAASPAAVAFFESPEGVAFLHGLVVAAHLVMTWAGPCGIRLVCRFIELAGLGAFVTTSYGAHQRVSAGMQSELAEYGREERARLAVGMGRKRITVCEDETFLSEDICLVAMEPVSGFVLLEAYAERRDTQTWNAALGDAVQDLDVEVIQSTSDEAAALARHAKALGAEHSPDLFHVQNEVGRAMALSLSGREERATEAHERAAEEVKRQVEAERTYWENPRGRGRPPAFARRICEARAAEEETTRQLEKAKEHRRSWIDALHGIERAYHPFDLATGRSRPAEQVAGDLAQSFDRLDRIAKEAGLSQGAREHLDKARRVVPKMVASVGFFHVEVHRRVESLGLPPEQESLLHENLIPSAYLHRAAARTQNRDKRAEIRRTLDDLLSASFFPRTFAASLSEPERSTLEKVAFACADVFQRSSSCIEGRNGRLSEFEHAMRRLHPKKLAGLTVIHNYFIERPDRTTAAERFFGAAPRDLFAWLTARLPLPPRPSRPRASAEKQCLFKPM